jgi:hypothetical protein
MGIILSGYNVGEPMTKKDIETALIAFRMHDTRDLLYEYTDPFICYQDGLISKRKLIEIITKEITLDN